HLDATGAVLQDFALGVFDPQAAAVGPDGDIYISYPNSSTVAQFNPSTGLFDNFNFAFGGATLGAKWSPDNTLWVADSNGALYHYDQTGAFLGSITTFGAPITPQADLDQNVWESDFFSGVLEFDPSGNFLRSAAASAPIGLAVAGSDMPISVAAGS